MVVDEVIRDVVGVDGTPVPAFDEVGREVVDDLSADEEAGLRRPAVLLVLLDRLPG